MKTCFITILVGSTLFTSSPASACTGVMGTPISWVRDADVVLRARTLSQFPAGARQAAASPSLPDTVVRFQVLEVLKGPAPGPVIEFAGVLTERDDRNDRPVPYSFVRPEGRGGSCFAFSYKRDADYLFLLRNREGVLTPYWATLGSTNEQLFGAEDQWLAWVRQQLDRQLR